MQATMRKIVVLGTGGTIAGRAASAQDNVGYVAGQVGVADLLGSVEVPPECEVRAEQLAQLDSKDMDFAVWRRLAERCTECLRDPLVAGIVITHGTDTMEETAFLLHEVLDACKPVVLTGAMRPATSAQADGPTNLRDALAVAACGAQGVCVVFAGEVHAAPDVYKAHTYRVDAFSSGDAGPFGVIEESRLRLVRDWPPARGAALPAGEWPRVEIVLNYAGASGTLVDTLVRQGVQGIVAAGTGNGTLHRDLEAALLRAQAAGVKVVRSTRCAGGAVTGHAGDRLPHAGALSPVKARVALMLELMRTAPAARAA